MTDDPDPCVLDLAACQRVCARGKRGCKVDHGPPGGWSPEEKAVLAEIMQGRPAAPSPALRYWLTDCFACGFVSIRRQWSPPASLCPNCGLPVQAVIVCQLPEEEPDGR